MKFYYSRKYNILYFLENGRLAGMPAHDDDIYDQEESFLVEPDNDEFPRREQLEIIKKLT